MPTLLPILSKTNSEEPTETRWHAFLLRRADLVARMELATCDGCDGCGARCVEGFTVTREEYEAVQSYRAGMPAEEIARIDQQPAILPWPGAEDSGIGYARCRYRDVAGNRCSVYPARPTVCRLFGHTEWLPCPIGAVRQTPADAAEVWNAYRALERRTFAEWEARQKSGDPL